MRVWARSPKGWLVFRDRVCATSKPWYRTAVGPSIGSNRRSAIWSETPNASLPVERARFAAMTAVPGVDIGAEGTQRLWLSMGTRRAAFEGIFRVKLRRVFPGGVFLAVALSGCAALPGFGPAPVDIYELTAPTPVSTGGRLSRTQILVTEPSALKALDGQDIVIKTGPSAIQLLKG